MRTRTPAVLAVTAAATAVLVAGCGSATGVKASPPDSSASSPSPVCGDIQVTPSGVARNVCLDVGSTLRLRLGRGDPPATEKGAALIELSPGVYRGARTGSAELSGFRHSCPSAQPGGLSCLAIAGWQVTVHVR
jgi:hypothetical protein